MFVPYSRNIGQQTGITNMCWALDVNETNDILKCIWRDFVCIWCYQKVQNNTRHATYRLKESFYEDLVDKKLLWY